MTKSQNHKYSVKKYNKGKDIRHRPSKMIYPLSLTKPIPFNHAYFYHLIYMRNGVR